MNDAAKEAFVAKLDAFAETLEPQEQALLIELLGLDDGVIGFKMGWPGLGSLGVWKAPAGTEGLDTARDDNELYQPRVSGLVLGDGNTLGD